MDGNFWNDFLANFLSDLIAGVVIAGVVGFVVNLWWNKRQGKEEAQTRKVKMLTLIRRELNHNLEVLASREPSDPHTIRNDTLERFKDELWNAFSDGGELQWIQDLDLLDSIAAAYYRIRTVIAIEDSLRQHFLTAGIKASAGAKGVLKKPLKTAEDELSRAVSLAIDAIDETLPV